MKKSRNPEVRSAMPWCSPLYFRGFVEQLVDCYQQEGTITKQMQSSEEKPVLKYDNIVVSSRGMAEVHGRKVVIFVPAAEINRIILKFGRAEHNPVVSICIGAVLALAGIFGLIVFFIGKKGNRYDLGLVALGVIGGSLIFDAFKQRYFLEIDKKNETRRLVLSKNAKKESIDELCGKIRTIYKYGIADDVRHDR